MKPEATQRSQDDHDDVDEDLREENQDIYYISDLDSNSQDASHDIQKKRISCKSKVNFSKLSDQEKILRLQNMANLIKKLKQ